MNEPMSAEEKLDAIQDIFNNPANDSNNAYDQTWEILDAPSAEPKGDVVSIMRLTNSPEMAKFVDFCTYQTVASIERRNGIVFPRGNEPCKFRMPLTLIKEDDNE